MTRLRYFLADLGFWLKTNPARAGVSLLAFGLLLATAALGIRELASTDSDRAIGPAPQVVVRTEEPPDDPADLGFPSFATANTTRVAGADSVAVAAGVALAAFPAAPGVEGPSAVTLVESSQWSDGIAAASLVAAPVGAPILLSEDGELSELTAGALAALAPTGSDAKGQPQVFAIGNAPEPAGVQTRKVEGDNPAAVAAEIAGLRQELSGSAPAHLLIASSDAPEFAMPAAAWAARSGDPVLFTGADSVPKETLDVISSLPRVPVYLLGSEAVISRKAAGQIKKATNAGVERAANETSPVANAIDFSRYLNGNFGWNINDPGHGFVIASTSRPADAGAAAALSASGSFGPLLLTDDEQLSAELEAYLLDLKPGYEDDPTRAFYNHVWIIGDANVITVEAQVVIDEIVALAPIRSGQGGSLLDLPSDSADQDTRNTTQKAKRKAGSKR